MSDVVKMLAALPGDDDTNGLDCWGSKLVRRAHDQESTMVVALVVLDVKRVSFDADTGDEVPHMRIRKIEPIADDHASRSKVAELFLELNEQRRGMSPIPFDQMEGRRDHVEVRHVDDELPEADDE